jgi:hypothetical protein
MRTTPTAAALAATFAVLAVLTVFALGAPGAHAQEGSESSPAQGPGHVGDAMIQNPAPDPAEALAARVEAALGGREAWDETRFLSFGFAERRMHWWDRYTGRHRVEGTDREDRKYVVLHDVDDRGAATGSGRAWLDGEEQEGDVLAGLLENAYGAWINDTYWLLAPYKLHDPGVTLSHDGTETVDGVTYEKLKLTFEGVGLTPGDTYWMYVHPETDLVDRWAYVLEGQRTGDEEPSPTVWEWRGWQEMGSGILLAPSRIQASGENAGREISLAPVAVPAELPDAVFESAEWRP